MASVVREVLREELARARGLRRKYERKLGEYPRGYLLKRKVHSRHYFYLSYREGSHIRQKYLGSLSPEKLKEYQNKIGSKRALQKQLAEVRQNIKYLERLLKK